MQMYMRGTGQSLAEQMLPCMTFITRRHALFDNDHNGYLWRIIRQLRKPLNTSNRRLPHEHHLQLYFSSLVSGTIYTNSQTYVALRFYQFKTDRERSSHFGFRCPSFPQTHSWPTIYPADRPQAAAVNVGSKTGISTHSVNRLLRWALILLEDFGQADSLPQLISNQPTTKEDAVIAAVYVDKGITQQVYHTVRAMPVSILDIKQETASDNTLQQAIPLLGFQGKEVLGIDDSPRLLVVGFWHYLH
ncbi:unnamed protein product [Mesocestoides corti]|uniref:Transposable element n=1 Tax=Mesocestoides corti TaxID=53468 RepID=A0A0R3U8T5_MESCO|nr:unnamed protein product [Mesocestoides corti]